MPPDGSAAALPTPAKVPHTKRVRFPARPLDAGPVDRAVIRDELLRGLRAVLLDPMARSTERSEARRMLVKLVGTPDAAEQPAASEPTQGGPCANCSAAKAVDLMHKIEAAIDELEREGGRVAEERRQLEQQKAWLGLEDQRPAW